MRSCRRTCGHALHALQLDSSEQVSSPFDKESKVPGEQILLTPERAADQLDVGRTTIYALIASGDLDSVKIGRSRRIPSDALVAYVERLRSQGASGRPNHVHT